MKVEDRFVAGVLISEEDIKKRVCELGAQLSVDYADKNPIFICILKGSVIFYADLARAIDCHMEMEFMAISSYGNGIKTSGIVRIAKDLDANITDRHVVIVEDIMDSGLTLHYLKSLLEKRMPASLNVVCLLDKPSRRECDIKPDYCGFEIPNEYVIGYGLDQASKYRNLPYVGIYKNEE